MRPGENIPDVKSSLE